MNSLKVQLQKYFKNFLSELGLRNSDSAGKHFPQIPGEWSYGQ